MTDKLSGWNPDLKTDVADIRPGDTVRVHLRIVEGNRERIQVIQGVVMRMRSAGVDATFTVRRIAAHGIGVERTFMLMSPRIDHIEIVRRAQGPPCPALLFAQVPRQGCPTSRGPVRHSSAARNSSLLLGDLCPSGPTLSMRTSVRPWHTSASSGQRVTGLWWG